MPIYFNAVFMVMFVWFSIFKCSFHTMNPDVMRTLLSVEN